MIRILWLFILGTISCNQNGSSFVKQSFKDSITRQYLSIKDSVSPYDTSNYETKILRAYIYDDTSFFKKLKKEIDMREQYVYPYKVDSCMSTQKLSDMPVDEAFRFIHSQSFCIFGQTITITRKDSLVKLHYAEYILPEQDGHRIVLTDRNGNRYVVDSNCKILKQFEKTLNAKDWQKLNYAADRTEYWGLKHSNPRILMDGSFWRIDAYVKEPRYPSGQQVYSVYRQSPELKEFSDFGLLFMKFAGEKGMCEDLF
jgi:hypothetical protein